MRDESIQSGDVMIVDRSLEPKNRSIVLAVIDGEFTVKRVNVNDQELYLMPENDSFTPIKITEEMDFQIWGVVTYIIHKSSMITLADCNNFYASCERVFNPKIERKPVVVLSNNDGCIIARSNELKS